MHIAICDDNIADRKQLERLLQRESDKLHGSREPYYIDSYGNPEAVMSSPTLYKAFFIDMTASEKNGYEITQDLLHTGVTVPIILCISTINYREYDLPGNCYFLQKPICVNDLTDMLDIVLKTNDAVKVPQIEIRTEKDTVYLHEKDIMYIATEKHLLKIHLTNGTVLETMDSFENFYDSISHFPCFLPVSYKAIVNVAYISHTSFFSVYAKNGRKFFLHPNFRKYVHYMFAEYQRTSTQ
ncbi:MAG: hypothetical protein IJN54_12435 [Lachnospiraceae bacterium]|nr:hypothetical protein [Lachnospiraceae bacterium]